MNTKHHLKSEHFRFYQVDILDFDILKILCKDIDIIVHLAAEKKIGESQLSIPTLQVNTETKNILEIAECGERGCICLNL